LHYLILNGKVVSGQGSGKKYLELPWVMQQMEQKLGFTPYPGTLNLLLSEESTRFRKLLEKAKSVKICPAEGYCIGIVVKAAINRVECAVVIPQVEGYPENILEIIAPSNLRETLKIKDGDSVAVAITA
jgi:riboflavin kinase, archaea type